METDAQVYLAYYWRKYNAQKKAAKKKGKKGKKGKKKGSTAAKKTVVPVSRPN